MELKIRWLAACTLGDSAPVSDDASDAAGFSLRDALKVDKKAAGPVSVLDRAAALTIKHFHLNLIRVGTEIFSDQDLQTMKDGLGILQVIFLTAGVGVGSTDHYSIPLAQADGYAFPSSEAQADAITEEWSFPDDRLDVFVVAYLPGTSLGFAPPLGSCRKGLNLPFVGCVIRYESDYGVGASTDFVFAKILAHEVGHYLGLPHVSDPNNLMYPTWPSGVQLTAEQGAIMKKHCFIRFGCPPPKLD
jgi:hypothetical protein